MLTRLWQAPALVLTFSLATSSVWAQGRVVVTENAPIYAVIGAVTPLRTAAAGTSLVVVKPQGNWIEVQYQDPASGLKSGFVQARYVRADDGASLAGSLIASAVITWVVALTFVGIRLYTRTFIVRVRGAEDWTILVALVRPSGLCLNPGRGLDADFIAGFLTRQQYWFYYVSVFAALSSQRLCAER